MSNSRPRWEKPKATRTAPQRYGIAGEYFKAVTGDPKATAQSAQNTAYRVLGDYIRYSESLARGRPQDAFRTARGGGSGGDYRSMAVNFFEMWTQFAETWFQLLEQGGELRGGPMPDLSEFIRDPGDGDGVVADGMGRFTLRVTSEVPVESSIRITARDSSDRIVVHSLRSVAEGVAPIAMGIDAGEGEGEFVLKISVPADQPCGVYSGLVIDQATETPVGDVTVKVLEAT